MDKRPRDRVKRWTAAALLLLGACSGRPTSPADAADARAAPDSAGVDRGGQDRSVEGRSDDGPLPPIEGLIYLSEIQDLAGAQQGAAYAFFTPDPLPFFTVVKALGAGCAVFPDDEVGPVQYSAGEISISGSYSFKLKPEAPTKPGDWLYPGMLYPDLFAPGGMVSVSAVGDQISAFKIEASGAADLQPSFPSGTVSRSAPLEITFSPTSGELWVTLTALLGGKQVKGGNIRCTGLAASSGKVSLPQAVLGALPLSADTVSLGAGLAEETVLDRPPRDRIHVLAAHLTATVRKLVP